MSGGEPVTAFAAPHHALANDHDSVGWYLRAASSQPLLEPEEVEQLSAQVQRLLSWHEKSAELRAASGRAPSDAEMASALGLGGGADEYALQLQMLRADRRRLVSANLLLVVSIAKKFLHQGLPMQDLIQEGSLGLIKAAEKFEPARGHRFSTYATHWIRGEMSRAVAQTSRTIRLPEKVHWDIQRVRRARRDLAALLERPPTEGELAEHLELPAEKVLAIDTSQQTVATVSINAPVRASQTGEGREEMLENVISDPKPRPEDACDAALVDEALRVHVAHLIDSTLTEQESEVLRMRYGLPPRGRDGAADEASYGEPIKPMQIARTLELSSQRVRDILYHAMKKMRRHLAAHPVTPPGEAGLRMPPAAAPPSHDDWQTSFVESSFGGLQRR